MFLGKKLKIKMSFYHLPETPLMIHIKTDWQIGLISKLVFVNGLKFFRLWLPGVTAVTEVLRDYSSLMFIPEF